MPEFYNFSKVPSDVLSHNPTDIESSLWGINSTNLVTPAPSLVPNLKTLPTISFFDKPVVVNERNRDFLTKLVQNGPDEYPGAKILERRNGENVSLRHVDRKMIQLELGDKVHRHMMDGDYVLFNRQPSLHKMSMMCHEV